MVRVLPGEWGACALFCGAPPPKRAKCPEPTCWRHGRIPKRQKTFGLGPKKRPRPGKFLGHYQRPDASSVGLAVRNNPDFPSPDAAPPRRIPGVFHKTRKIRTKGIAYTLSGFLYGVYCRIIFRTAAPISMPPSILLPVPIYLRRLEGCLPLCSPVLNCQHKTIYAYVAALNQPCPSCLPARIPPPSLALHTHKCPIIHLPIIPPTPPTPAHSQ